MSTGTPGGPYPQGPGQPPPGGWPQGPGPQYPAGPPPQNKKRHWVRWGCLGLVAIVAVIIIVSVASSGNGTNTTPSGTGATAGSGTSKASSSSSPSQAAAGVGSYFDVKDSSGHTYRVALDKVIDPAQGADQFSSPDADKRFVGTVFTITALNGSPSNENANSNAVIVGSDGQTYTADFNSIAGYTNFNSGEIQVAQGEKATGAVTFQVPTGVKVAKVQWTAGFGSAVQWNVS